MNIKFVAVKSANVVAVKPSLDTGKNFKVVSLYFAMTRLENI